MNHKPILIKDLELSFPHKTCFEKFNCLIPYGSRIAIIGKNGSGKSTLLRMIANISEPPTALLEDVLDIKIGYVPQILTGHADLSGGERFNSALTAALSYDPNVLLLDEPTNHLDLSNRKGLLGMLQRYLGTLIIVSHDTELLRHCINTFWHIDNGSIDIFTGYYDDYVRENRLKRDFIERELALINRQKKEAHKKLMQEQQRAAKSRASGEKKIENRK